MSFSCIRHEEGPTFCPRVSRGGESSASHDCSTAPVATLAADASAIAQPTANAALDMTLRSQSTPNDATPNYPRRSASGWSPRPMHLVELGVEELGVVIVF